MPGAGRLRGHDEPGPALWIQVAVEVGNPQVVAVGNGFLAFSGIPFPVLARALGGSRQPERQSAVGLHLLGIDQVYVERRIGHHEIAATEQVVLVLIEGVSLANVTLQPMHSQIHPGQANRGGGLLLPVEGDLVAGVLSLALDKMAGLHEHAAGTASGIEDDAVFGFDDVDEGLHQ